MPTFSDKEYRKFHEYSVKQGANAKDDANGLDWAVKSYFTILGKLRKLSRRYWRYV